ncbi:MAG: hypothetical protein ABJH08_01340 [Balneola sp.]
MKFRLTKNLETPCADISFKWLSGRKSSLIIRLHFSRVKDGFDKDIKLVFTQPISVVWEDESFQIFELPENLPRCESDNFKNWTYPSLVLHESKWVDLYAARMLDDESFKNHELKHFVFLSMNDLLHVLSYENPKIEILNA